MEIKIEKTNGVRFKVWINEWDTEFDTLHDARRFCSYTKGNNPEKKSRIEVILVETLTWDGEHGTYKNHILATIKTEEDKK